MMNQWMLVADAAALLGLDERSIHQRVERQQMTGKRLAPDGIPMKGRWPERWHVLRSEVEEELRQRQQAAPAVDPEVWILTRDAAQALGTTEAVLLSRIYRNSMTAKRLPVERQGRSPYHLRWHVLRSEVESEIALRERYEPLTVAEAAWLAGFIDGEGCIVIFRTAGRGCVTHSLCLRVVSTDREPLEWVRERVGGFIPTPRRSREEWRMVYQWSASALVAERALRAALPYLRIKHRQAAIAIRFQERIRKCHGHRFNPPSVDEIRWRDEQRETISRLNQRQPI